MANLTHAAEINALFLPVETIPIKKLMINNDDYNIIPHRKALFFRCFPMRDVFMRNNRDYAMII